jgi:hypothetical protein
MDCQTFAAATALFSMGLKREYLASRVGTVMDE